METPQKDYHNDLSPPFHRDFTLALVESHKADFHDNYSTSRFTSSQELVKFCFQLTKLKLDQLLQLSYCTYTRSRIDKPLGKGEVLLETVLPQEQNFPAILCSRCQGDSFTKQRQKPLATKPELSVPFQLLGKAKQKAIKN